MNRPLKRTLKNRNIAEKMTDLHQKNLDLNLDADNDLVKPIHELSSEETEMRLESALDKLRVERGKYAIFDEDLTYEQPVYPVEDIEDFTTTSIQMNENDESLTHLQAALKADQPQEAQPLKKRIFRRNPNLRKPKAIKEPTTKNEVVKEGTGPIQKQTTGKIKRNQTGKIRKEGTAKIRRENTSKIGRGNTGKIQRGQTGSIKKQTTEKTGIVYETTSPVVSGKKRIQIPFKYILIGVLAFAAILGVYAYKTLIYDPENIVTAKQQEVYNILVDYADEWDMLSDSEKNELLDYEDDYKSFGSKQRDDINNYFKEQTDSTLTSILNDLRSKNAATMETDYNNLVVYLNSWNSYDETGRGAIVNYVEMFNRLSNEQKQKIDDLCMQIGGTDFDGLCEAYLKESKNQEDSEKKIKEYEQQKTLVENQLATYQYNAETYESYLEDPAAYGMTEDQVQQKIDANNQAIEQLENQLDVLDKEINALSD